jgi:hypothetical protein
MAGCLKLVFVAGLCLVIGLFGLSMMNARREVDRTIDARNERIPQAENTENTAKENVEAKSTQQLYLDELGIEVKFIPGLSPAEICSKFTGMGFGLREEVFDRGDQVWQGTLGDSPQSLEDKNVTIYGVAPDGVISVTTYYVNTSGDDSRRATNAGCRPFFADVARISYEGSQPNEAKAWVTKNLGKNVTKEFGGVTFELIANPDSVRSRVLLITVEGDDGDHLNQQAEQDPAFREKKAASKVKMAKLLLNEKDNSVAKKRLQEIVDDYPETEGAKEAEGLLEKL